MEKKYKFTKKKSEENIWGKLKLKKILIYSNRKSNNHLSIFFEFFWIKLEAFWDKQQTIYELKMRNGYESITCR